MVHTKTSHHDRMEVFLEKIQGATAKAIRRA